MYRNLRERDIREQEALGYAFKPVNSIWIRWSRFLTHVTLAIMGFGVFVLFLTLALHLIFMAELWYMGIIGK